jgi:hypothetical protein
VRCIHTEKPGFLTFCAVALHICAAPVPFSGASLQLLKIAGRGAVPWRFLHLLHLHQNGNHVDYRFPVVRCSYFCPMLSLTGL